MHDIVLTNELLAALLALGLFDLFSPLAQLLHDVLLVQLEALHHEPHGQTSKNYGFTFVYS